MITMVVHVLPVANRYPNQQPKQALVSEGKLKVAATSVRVRRLEVGRGILTAPRASEGAQYVRNWTPSGGAVGTQRLTHDSVGWVG